MEVNWDNSKYLELRDYLSVQLEKRSYVTIRETTTTKTYSKGNHHIRIIDQRYDPPEVWIGTKEIEKNNIRLDFIIEFYLTGKIEMIKKYNRINRSGRTTYEFYVQFLDKYLKKLIQVDPKEYYEFGRSNNENIKSLIDELNDNH